MALPNTTYGAERIDEMLRNAESVYFLGIGGVSVSSLARMTKDLGYRVGGYDRGKTDVTRSLEQEGIEIRYEADPAHLEGYDAVVYTLAIPDNHPEYVAAREKGLTCISRADYLGYLMTAYHHRIGFSGSHGKSTATCMAAQILMDAGANPTVLAGASMPGLSGMFRRGGKENMVFEACEYMDSFLQFSPTVAVVLNIEMDHVDYFHSMEQLRTSFRAFCERTGKTGTVILNADDSETQLALDKFNGTVITYSMKTQNADYYASEVQIENGYAAFTVCVKATGECHKVRLPIPGVHHVWNALAAIAAVSVCGVDAGTAARSLLHFCGADRRMQYWGKINGAKVFEDYAHHPTEVAATLQDAAKLGTGRLLCLFQPHTYSRTRALFDDFVKALRCADCVIIAPIYAARELPDSDVNASLMAEAIGNCAVSAGNMEEAAELLMQNARKGDTVIIMGAGDINRVLPMLPLEK